MSAIAISPAEGTKGRILLVDDTPATLSLLVGVLRERGYAVHPAKEGALAMRFVQTVVPDLVLLDVRMPGMDGYEVCRGLKQDPRTRAIPVIFLSSADQVIDKVKAFQCGAVDYISKPFEPAEVLARIETQLSLRRLTEDLETAVRERTAELTETNVRLQREIAERQSIEEALRASEQRFAMAFRASPIPLGIATFEGSRFLMVNDEFGHALDHSPEDLVGQSVREIGLWSDPDVFAAVTRELSDEGRIHNREGTVVTRRGEVRAMLYSVEIIELDARPCLLFAAFDITDRKRAEGQLKQSAEEISLLYNDAPCGYFSLDANGFVERMNDTQLSWLGYSRHEVVRRMHISDLLTPQSLENLERRLPHLNAHSRYHDLELEMVRQDGSLIPVLLNLCVPGNGGKAVLNANVFDITERKLLESRFLEAQKMEAVGRLAGGIAHDFNNLLTVILGYSDLVLKQLPSFDPVRQAVGEVRTAAVSAASLTRQLLAFSRKQVLEPRVLDLNVLLSSVRNMLQRLIGEDIDFVIRLDPGLGRVRADPGQIEQVIFNLAVNARDAMPRGGQLTVETADVLLLEEIVAEDRSLPPGPYCVLSVTDTGEGMDAQIRQHIFEPFFTTKAIGKGTGLGLATVYGIIRQSRGWIQVDSEKGRGTTFRIYLPRIEDQPEEAAPDSAVMAAALPATILLVEDAATVREVAAAILRNSGYTVLEAAGGREASELCTDRGDEIALMITDIVMRDARGPELVQALAPLCPRMRVLYMSGYADIDVSAEGLLEGNAPFLQKPFTPDGLLQKVQQTLKYISDHSL